MDSSYQSYVIANLPSKKVCEYIFTTPDIEAASNAFEKAQQQSAFSGHVFFSSDTATDTDVQIHLIHIDKSSTPYLLNEIIPIDANSVLMVVSLSTASKAYVMEYAYSLNGIVTPVTSAPSSTPTTTTTSNN